MNNLDLLQNNIQLIASSSYGIYQYQKLAEFIDTECVAHNCNLESLNIVLNEDPTTTENECYWDAVNDLIDCSVIYLDNECQFLVNEDIWLIKEYIFDQISEETLNGWCI